MSEFLIEGHYPLKQFSGKGGWTYVETPAILPSKNNPFGWVTVKGRIDDFELRKHKLMPMGNGTLFLSVRAEIRKKIKKEAGDTVFVQLALDEAPLELPEELIACFLHEPKKRYETFVAMKESEQQAYLDWIYSAKTENTKAARILEMMDRLKQGLGRYEKKE